MFLSGSYLSFKLSLYVNMYQIAVQPVSYSGAQVRAVLRDKIHIGQCVLMSKMSPGTET